MDNYYARKKIRLSGYDYSLAGCYFITICVHGRREMLGCIGQATATSPSESAIVLSEYGEIAKDWIEKIPLQYPCSKIDAYVIMPNHIHAIVRLTAERGRDDPTQGVGFDPAPTISRIIGYYKYQTTKQLNIPGFWQRSFFDRIIRDDDEYSKIAAYIVNNPLTWVEDRYYQGYTRERKLSQ